MDDLIVFLLDRLVGREARLQWLTQWPIASRVFLAHDNGEGAANVGEFDVDAELADVLAKRKIVLHIQALMPLEGSAVELVRRELLPVLQYLALPYAGHPDYREEWRP